MSTSLEEVSGETPAAEPRKKRHNARSSLRYGGYWKHKEMVRVAVLSGAMNLLEASKAYRIPYTAVMKWSSNEGWLRGRRAALLKRKQKAKTISAIAERDETKHGLLLTKEEANKMAKQQVADALATREKEIQRDATIAIQTVAGHKKNFRGKMARTLSKVADSLAAKAEEEPEVIFGKADKLASLAKAGRDVFGEDAPTGSGLVVSLAFLSGGRGTPEEDLADIEESPTVDVESEVISLDSTSELPDEDF